MGSALGYFRDGIKLLLHRVTILFRVSFYQFLLSCQFKNNSTFDGAVGLCELICRAVFVPAGGFDGDSLSATDLRVSGVYLNEALVYLFLPVDIRHDRKRVDLEF
jgi:hypothetical protein